MFRVEARTLIAAGAALPLAHAVAQPGDYPLRPVRVILPLPPAGPTDAIALRLMRNQGYQPWTQFTPVATTVAFSTVLVAHPSVQANRWTSVIRSLNIVAE